ncbi:MAG: site-2 protease family protein [Nanoarchaeota archaeon]
MNLRFSSIEKQDILKAWFAISLAFAILLTRNFSSFFLNFIISIFTVGLGFLIHELAHKYFAQKYRCFAEFRADNKMLLIAVVSSFFGFIFAAPGGVIINGFVDRKKYALIAAAGPITNILLAIIFLLSNNFLQLVSLQKFFSFGFSINSWLALFNLIPIFPFDGEKIVKGNKKLYFALVMVAFSLFILPYL